LHIENALAYREIFAKEMQKKIRTIPTATMKGVAAGEWPGNIRELENFIERAVILTRGESLEAPLSELRKPSSETAPLPQLNPSGRLSTDREGNDQRCP
jgi:formate hydrogenlyase transcriptional activator